MTPNQIMLRLGFPSTETGPFVSQVRAEIVRLGLVDSHVSWASGAEGLSHEERARCWLEMHWEAEQNHAFRVEAMDGWRENGLRPWLRDRARQVAMHVRIFWHRLLRRRNPYRAMR
jgi:hypothetical protein